MDAAPKIAGLEGLTPPDSVASLIGFVNELTERTRLFEADSIPRTGLVQPFQGQILGEKIAEKYAVAVTTQVQWDQLRERYIVRVDDAKSFTKWLVKWQQTRLEAMYGAEHDPNFFRESAPFRTSEAIAAREQLANPEVVRTASRFDSRAIVPDSPRGYQTFRDSKELELADQPLRPKDTVSRQKAPQPESTPTESQDEQDRLKSSVAKGNKAVWSGNAAGGTAAAGYQAGQADAAGQATGMMAKGANPASGGYRYRPPTTIFLVPGQTHFAQQGDIVMTAPDLQGGGQSGPLGALPLGRVGGILGALAMPALGSTLGNPLGMLGSFGQGLIPGAETPVSNAVRQIPSGMITVFQNSQAPPALGDYTNLKAQPVQAPIQSRPENGMMTIFSAPMRVSSAASEAGGAAVEVPIGQLTARSGALDAGALAQLKANLPPGASLMYPALPNNALPPGAANVQVAPSLLSEVLQRAYGPEAASQAGDLSQQAVTGVGPRPTQPMQASLVPQGRPAGNAASILPQTGSAGNLGDAGSGMAGRGGALDFLGLPVRVAPSLGGKSELRDEIAARQGIQSSAQPQSSQPDKFAALRSRMLNGQPSMDVEPDQAKWEQARPSFGMAGGSAMNVLSPEARVKPPTATSPLPQMGSYSSPSGYQPIRTAIGNSGALENPIASPTFELPEKKGHTQSNLSPSMGLDQSSRIGPSLMPISGDQGAKPTPVQTPSPIQSPSLSVRGLSPFEPPKNQVIGVPDVQSPPKMTQIQPEIPRLSQGVTRPEVADLPALPVPAGGPMAFPLTEPITDVRPRSEPSWSSGPKLSSPAMPSVQTHTKGTQSDPSFKSPFADSSERGLPKQPASLMQPIMVMPPPTPILKPTKTSISSGIAGEGIIQRAVNSDAPPSSSSGQGSRSESQGPRHGNTGGGSAQDVDGLAHEVYSIIKRRLSVEAMRKGR